VNISQMDKIYNKLKENYNKKMIMKVMYYIKINKIKLPNQKQKDHQKTRIYQRLLLLTLIKHNKFK